MDVRSHQLGEGGGRTKYNKTRKNQLLRILTSFENLRLSHICRVIVLVRGSTPPRVSSRHELVRTPPDKSRTLVASCWRRQFRHSVKRQNSPIGVVITRSTDDATTVSSGWSDEMLMVAVQSSAFAFSTASRGALDRIGRF
jgi:hypothetical protein